MSTLTSNVLAVRPASPDSGLAIPTFNPTDDQTESINKDMMFLNKAFTMKYLPTNNQLMTSSNPRTRANVQVGRVTVMKEEEWGTLDIEEHDFMADWLESFDSDCEDELNPTLVFMEDHVEDRVDAFDSDYDEEATVGAIFMVKLSPTGSVAKNDVGPSYDADPLSRVPSYDNYDMLNLFSHETQHSEQSLSVNVTSVTKTNYSNVILDTRHTNTNEDEVVQHGTSHAKENTIIKSVIENIQREVE
ncbi:hypothetical protein Tco_0232976 [Tanacetum coccineum]